MPLSTMQPFDGAIRDLIKRIFDLTPDEPTNEFSFHFVDMAGSEVLRLEQEHKPSADDQGAFSKAFDDQRVRFQQLQLEHHPALPPHGQTTSLDGAGFKMHVNLSKFNTLTEAQKLEILQKLFDLFNKEKSSKEIAFDFKLASAALLTGTFDGNTTFCGHQISKRFLDADQITIYFNKYSSMGAYRRLAEKISALLDTTLMASLQDAPCTPRNDIIKFNKYVTSRLAKLRLTGKYAVYSFIDSVLAEFFNANLSANLDNMPLCFIEYCVFESILNTNTCEDLRRDLLKRLQDAVDSGSYNFSDKNLSYANLEDEQLAKFEASIKAATSTASVVALAPTTTVATTQPTGTAVAATTELTRTATAPAATATTELTRTVAAPAATATTRLTRTVSAPAAPATTKLTRTVAAPAATATTRLTRTVAAPVAPATTKLTRTVDAPAPKTTIATVLPTGTATTRPRTVSTGKSKFIPILQQQGTKKAPTPIYGTFISDKILKDYQANLKWKQFGIAGTITFGVLGVLAVGAIGIGLLIIPGLKIVAIISLGIVAACAVTLATISAVVATIGYVKNRNVINNTDNIKPTIKMPQRVTPEQKKRANVSFYVATDHDAKLKPGKSDEDRRSFPCLERVASCKA